MSRLALLFFTLCASIFMTVASPIPAAALDKRTTYTGRGTWFDVGMGACGYENVNSDSIIAISQDIYGDGGDCNQWVQVTNLATGQTAWGQIRDECESCGPGDLDMSPGLFQQIGDLNTGVLSISWNFD